MNAVASLLSVIDAYQAADGASDKTVSGRVFKDSKKLAALRDGMAITTDRFERALEWLSENWPTDAAWPDGVARP